MTFPVNPQFGPAVINLHLVFEMLAYVLGYRYYIILRSRSADVISSENRMWLIIAAAAGALAGSRLIGFYSVPLPEATPLAVGVHVLSNKSILGGLLGGTWAVEIAKRFLNIRTSSGDLFVYPIILGMILGRIGCFTQGVFDGTHGLPANLPWAIDMGDGIRRHPTQLYEIVFLGFMWVSLKAIEDRLADGAKFKIFMMDYLLFRFLTEWIKPLAVTYMGFSAVQLACIAGFVYYAPYFLNPFKLIKELHAKP